MKLPRVPYSKYNPPHEVSKHVQEVWEQLQPVVNGNIEFGGPGNYQNINGFFYSGVTPNVADTEFSVSHNLGRIPTGWIFCNKDQYSDLRTGATTWTAQTVSLKCSVASVNVVIFIF